MTYVLQVDFPMNGPFGDEMAEAFSETAQSINKEEGFVWKIWTENDEMKPAEFTCSKQKKQLRTIWICTQND